MTTRVRVARALIAAAAAALAVAAAGCATVHPWDRDLLAQQRMQLAPSPMLQSVDQHIQFSKEGSTGGAEAGGGGCGCN